MPSQKSRLYLKHIWPNIFDQICLDERPKHISLNRFRVKHNSKHISIKTCLNSNIFQICFKPNLFAEIGLKHKISNLFRNISRSDIRNIFQICFNRTFQTHFKTNFFWLGEQPGRLQAAANRDPEYDDRPVLGSRLGEREREYQNSEQY